MARFYRTKLAHICGLSQGCLFWFLDSWEKSEVLCGTQLSLQCASCPSNTWRRADSQLKEMLLFDTSKHFHNTSQLPQTNDSSPSSIPGAPMPWNTVCYTWGIFCRDPQLPPVSQPASFSFKSIPWPSPLDFLHIVGLILIGVIISVGSTRTG